jgi:CBS domain-containing protein
MMTNTLEKPQPIAAEITVGALVADLPHLRIHPECPLDTVLSIMAHSGKRVAAITENNGVFIGFITRSALLGRLVISPGFDVGYRIDTTSLSSMTAADAMIPNPAFLPSELSIADALAIMTEYGYHTMPVLGDEGKLIGLAEMRQLVEAHKIMTDNLAESKDNLLSYLMNHENYAFCGPTPADKVVITHHH